MYCQGRQTVVRDNYVLPRKTNCCQGQLCIAKEDKLLSGTTTYSQGKEQLSNAKEDKVSSGMTKSNIRED